MVGSNIRGWIILNIRTCRGTRPLQLQLRASAAASWGPRYHIHEFQILKWLQPSQFQGRDGAFCMKNESACVILMSAYESSGGSINCRGRTCFNTVKVKQHFLIFWCQCTDVSMEFWCQKMLNIMERFMILHIAVAFLVLVLSMTYWSWTFLMLHNGNCTKIRHDTGSYFLYYLPSQILIHCADRLTQSINISRPGNEI